MILIDFVFFFFLVVYLATHGVDPKSHPIKRELVSISQCVLLLCKVICALLIQCHAGTSTEGYAESEGHQQQNKAGYICSIKNLYD